MMVFSYAARHPWGNVEHTALETVPFPDVVPPSEAVSLTSLNAWLALRGLLPLPRCANLTSRRVLAMTETSRASVRNWPVVEGRNSCRGGAPLLDGVGYGKAGGEGFG